MATTAPDQAPETGAAARASNAAWLVRAEDGAIAVWVAVVAPAVIRLQASSGGIFDGGRPLDGAFGLLALLGAAICLATGSEGASASGFAASAVIGPFTGGFLLVAISTASALSLSEPVAIAVAAVIVAAAVGVRLRRRTLAVRVRRALMTPYLLVTGGLFWALIGAVTSGGDLVSSIRDAVPTDPSGALPVVGLLVAMAAVYYAMLMFAPRQVAEQEGGVVAWLARFAVFLASVALGAGWLMLLG